MASPGGTNLSEEERALGVLFQRERARVARLQADEGTEKVDPICAVCGADTDNNGGKGAGATAETAESIAADFVDVTGSDTHRRAILPRGDSAFHRFCDQIEVRSRIRKRIVERYVKRGRQGNVLSEDDAAPRPRAVSSPGDAARTAESASDSDSSSSSSSSETESDDGGDDDCGGGANPEAPTLADAVEQMKATMARAEEAKTEGEQMQAEAEAFFAHAEIAVKVSAAAIVRARRSRVRAATMLADAVDKMTRARARLAEMSDMIAGAQGMGVDAARCLRAQETRDADVALRKMLGYSVWNEILAASSRSRLDAACGASAGRDDGKDDMPELEDAPAAAIAPDDAGAGARELDAAKTPTHPSIDMDEVRRTGIPVYTSILQRVGYFVGTKDDLNGTCEHALVFDHRWPVDGRASPTLRPIPAGKEKTVRARIWYGLVTVVGSLPHRKRMADLHFDPSALLPASEATLRMIASHVHNAFFRTGEIPETYRDEQLTPVGDFASAVRAGVVGMLTNAMVIRAGANKPLPAHRMDSDEKYTVYAQEKDDLIEYFAYRGRLYRVATTFVSPCGVPIAPDVMVEGATWDFDSVPALAVWTDEPVPGPAFRVLKTRETEVAWLEAKLRGDARGDTRHWASHQRKCA